MAAIDGAMKESAHLGKAVMSMETSNEMTKAHLIEPTPFSFLEMRRRELADTTPHIVNIDATHPSL